MEKNLTSRYDAIIFDCDGTLVDTMPAHYRAWVETLTGYGIPFPEDRFYSMGGMATHKIVATLAQEAGVQLDSAAVALEKDERFMLELGAIRSLPAVVAIASAHRGLIPLGIATGATRMMAEAELTQVGILDWFTALACAEDVTRHKPFPDVYLEAARRVGVRPDRCLALDDTDIGLTAARSAGMEVIDVRLLVPSTHLAAFDCI